MRSEPDLQTVRDLVFVHQHPYFSIMKKRKINTNEKLLSKIGGTLYLTKVNECFTTCYIIIKTNMIIQPQNINLKGKINVRQNTLIIKCHARKIMLALMDERRRRAKVF